MIVDKMFINGNFYSRNGLNTINTIGVKDGIILTAGEQDQIDISGPVDVIDLRGKAVYPGFVDAHMHLISYCEKKFYEVDLKEVTSVEELVTKVKDFVYTNQIKSGEWVIGAGWNQELFDDEKLPDRVLLDKISTTHPIYLKRACYHMSVVNSLALIKAGISEHTRQISGGFMDTDKLGKPTGILRENAEALVVDILPVIQNKNQLKTMILRGCYDLAKVGITTVHTDDFGHIEDKHMLLEAFDELNEEGKLPIKVVLQLRAAEIEDIRDYKKLGLKSWTSKKNLMIGPIKIIADGSLGARTAALEEPYDDDKRTNGILTLEPKVLDELVREAVYSGFDMAIHAIGDRTMNIILDIYEKYIKEITRQRFRPSIIHCQIASEAILNRFRNLDIIANIQPIFLTTDWQIAEKRVGRQRGSYSYCWKKYMDMGITCIGSSDAPIESFNPLYGIYCAVTRKDMVGNPIDGWMPDEKLTVEQGIDLFTKMPAIASGERSTKGTLEEGKYADFVVLSDDLRKIDPDDIKSVIVEQVFVNGVLIKV